MKRVALIHLIRRAANESGLDLELLRDNGDHEWWAVDGQGFSVPRHREIYDITARSIMKRLEAKLGKEWWR